jgi:hypothetical protein
MTKPPRKARIDRQHPREGSALRLLRPMSSATAFARFVDCASAIQRKVGNEAACPIRQHAALFGQKSQDIGCQTFAGRIAREGHGGVAKSKNDVGAQETGAGVNVGDVRVAAAAAGDDAILDFMVVEASDGDNRLLRVIEIQGAALGTP